MKSLFVWVKKYWRAIVIFCCAWMMFSSYGQTWGETSWKAPDQYTVYTNNYGVEVDRERTSIGQTYYNGAAVQPAVQVISTVLLILVLIMYWRKTKRRFIAIPYGILFIFMWMASEGLGGEQFSVFMLMMGIPIFVRRKNV